MPDYRPFAPWYTPDASPERTRLPEPSPPPWINRETPPAKFYRPIFTAMTKGGPPSEEAMRAAYACAVLTRIGGVLPIVPCDDHD